MKNKFKKFLKSEDGLEIVEYAILLGLIVGAVLTLIVQLGNWTAAQYNGVVNKTSP